MRRLALTVLVAVVMLVSAGCSSPPTSSEGNAAVQELENRVAELTAAVEELESRNEELEARVAELDARRRELEYRNEELVERLSPEERVVDLVNPNFPPAVGGEPGWEYHQTLTADLDGDGQEEQVSVTTNAFWMPDRREFAWDDGHPWHVYVDEPDGSRTYLFSEWVQLGRLELILDREGPGLFIVYERGGGLVVYRAAYQGPGQFRTVLAFHIPLSDYATWADPDMFRVDPEG